MNTGWFADRSDDPAPGSPWQPFVQLPGGCFPLPIWFESEAKCNDFIEQNLVGLSTLDQGATDG